MDLNVYKIRVSDSAEHGLAAHACSVIALCHKIGCAFSLFTPLPPGMPISLVIAKVGAAAGLNPCDVPFYEVCTALGYPGSLKPGAEDTRTFCVERAGDDAFRIIQTQTATVYWEVLKELYKLLVKVRPDCTFGGNPANFPYFATAAYSRPGCEQIKALYQFVDRGSCFFVLLSPEHTGDMDDIPYAIDAICDQKGISPEDAIFYWVRLSGRFWPVVCAVDEGSFIHCLIRSAMITPKPKIRGAFAVELLRRNINLRAYSAAAAELNAQEKMLS